jgi:Chromosome segregation ATPases
MDDHKSVIAIRKSLKLGLGGQSGKLQPLLYSDGTSIDNIPLTFPNYVNRNIGEIFVPYIDEIPDQELVEVHYEINTHPRKDCEYVKSNNKHEITDKICDLIDVNEFYTVNQNIDTIFLPTNFFFLRNKNNGEVRGPFKRGAKEEHSRGWNVQLTYFHPTESLVKRIPLLKEKLIISINEKEIDSIIVTARDLDESDLMYKERTFISKPDVIFNLALKDPNKYFVDTMLTPDLLSWVRSIINERKACSDEQREEFRLLVLNLRDELKELDIPNNILKTRIDNIISFLRNSTEKELILTELGHNYWDYYLNTKNGLALLDRYIHERQTELLELYRDVVKEDVNKELQTQRDKINEDKELLEIREIELSKLESKLKEEEDRYSFQIKEKLTQELFTIESEIQEKNLHLTSLLEEIKYKERREHELQQVIDTLQVNLKTTDNELKGRMAEFKTYIDILSGMPPRSEIDKVSPKFNVAISKNQPPSLKDCIEQIKDNFMNSGREITFSQVTNYLTSIFQGFITIFAGYPGVGKTSTVELLANSLGLPSTGDIRRLLKINVGRGWVSSRDLVGFYNPLTQAFEPANTGLYAALETLTSEIEKDCLPLWILLDEMNLSPIEHYLSDFLTFADKHQGELTYGKHKMRFGNNLKFIGTVNHDETTESLSPRFVSRANVIYIPPQDTRNFSYKEGKVNPLSEMTVSMNTLRKLWEAEPDFLDDELDAFNELISCLQESTVDGEYLGHSTIIDPRVRKSVARYCSASRDLLQAEKGPLGALDYAVSQRVLTQIRGTGEMYYKRLIKVQELCKKHSFIQSNATIKRILENGQQYNEYDFFMF